MPKKIVDPTRNVLREIKHMEQRLSDKIDANNCHAKELREAESKRIDAIFNGNQRAGEVKNNQDALTIKELSNRVLELERTGSQNTGKSSIWSNPIILIIISAILGFIFAKYLK